MDSHERIGKIIGLLVLLGVIATVIIGDARGTGVGHVYESSSEPIAPTMAIPSPIPETINAVQLSHAMPSINPATGPRTPNIRNTIPHPVLSLNATTMEMT